MISISTFKESNVNWGVTISVLITFTSWVIVSFATGFRFIGFYISGDIQFILGTIFGVTFALKNRQEHQELLKYGVIVGIIGGIVSAFFIAFLKLFLLYVFNIIIFFVLFLDLFITAVVVGLIGGALIGTFFMYKELKGENEENGIDNDFYDSLATK